MKNIRLFLVWMLAAALAVSPVLAESPAGSVTEEACIYPLSEAEKAHRPSGQNPAGGGQAADKPALRVLIIPKFEIDEMSGDYPGEAQPFYERYFASCQETGIPNAPPTAHFYFNPESSAGLLVTGASKTSAALSIMALLASGNYDLSDTYIVSVGCAGGSVGKSTLGDVILVTSACDYDLGHHVDTHEHSRKDSRVTWFPDDSFTETGYRQLNAALCDKVYEMIRNCPLRTTEQSKTVMAQNFPSYTDEEILPSVKKGAALTGDNYWKGLYGHETANFIAEYYGCPDPYRATEMEEIAVANTADCFGLLDRMISLRVIVNMDVFMNGDTPESIWGERRSFSERVESTNEETLDIFEPGMYNLLDASAIVIDAILAGTF